MAPAVRYGILGPLEVRVDGELIAVGGPRVQAVLAALLLQEGKEVTADLLIDIVWGEQPPPSVRTSLQVHISRLRSVFGRCGLGSVITTHGSSYSLDVVPEQLDASRFRQLVADGRAFLGQGAVAEAGRVLDEALALWRGFPLTGLELPGLPPGMLGELEDQHDLAVVLRSEAELHLGRHAEVVPDLMRLRAEQPLDERVAELTALALYRSGRQADAIAELGSLRHDLAEQLGMEPGPSVADLERRILVGDPDLMPPAPRREAPREVRKTVTVVALRLPSGDPEDVLAATNAVSDLFDGVVDNLNGWCPPAGSGRLLGVFGVPTAHEDDAERAVRTADALNRASTALGLDVRLGVSTGEVLVEIGEEVRLLTHDPVEVADLLARKARPGEVLLGVATHRLAGAVAAVDPSQVLVIDDEEAPLVAHRLQEVADTRAAPRLSAPMVGREHDLQRLRDGAHRAFGERRPTLFVVQGPAGIGKSRLIQEFTAGLGDRVDVAIARCVPFGRDVGLWPVAEIVREIVGIPEGVTSRAAVRRMERFTADEPDGDVVRELLGTLVGLTDANFARDETFWAVRRCLEIASRRQALTVVLEDLQWAEDSLLDLVGYVSSTAADAPLVLLCSARPELDERRPTWGSAGADAVTLRLEALGHEETDELLGGLLGVNELARSARERITAAAEGNPLFLEEILSILIDDGYLQARQGRWEPSGDISVVPLPPTVKALLDARVDRLSSAERDVLEAAAVVGREFNLEDLSDLRPDSDPVEVVEVLDALCRRDLVDLRRFTSRGSSSYAFRHLLIRDVAYTSIPRDRRARDHERLGRALAERPGDRLGERHEIVGYHLETAFRLTRSHPREASHAAALGDLATTHLAAAGRRAFARDDATAAASLFGRALDCVGQDDRVRCDLARLRGAALFDLGRFSDARAVLLRGLEVADRSGDDAQRWRLQLELMELDVYTRPGERGARETQVFADQAIAALGGLGDLAGLARAYRLLGEALTLQGRLDEGIEAFEQGMRFAVEAGDEREVALPQRLMGLHGTTPLPVFIAHCEQHMANPSRRPRPEVVMRLAFAQALVGLEPDARRHVEEGLALAREVGGPFRVADAELYAGLALLYLGEPSEASTLLQDSVERLSELGEENLRSTTVGILGEARFRLGHLDEADQAAEQSRRLAADDDWASQILWRQVRAKVLAARNEIASACALITEATEIADRTDFLTMAAFAHLDASEVFARAEDRKAASHHRELAMSLFSRKGVSERVATLLRDRVTS